MLTLTVCALMWCVCFVPGPTFTLLGKVWHFATRGAKCLAGQGIRNAGRGMLSNAKGFGGSHA